VLTIKYQFSAVILVVVEDETVNIADQRLLEQEITMREPRANILRRTLTELSERANVDAEKKLIVDQREVAVVYFRAGYSPDHYPSEAEWKARLTLERSKAIKCPSIHYHLAGTKKVQQKLAEKGVLERFEGPAQMIRPLFTGLYHLDDKDIVKKAEESPSDFVLKPSREGGGNNVYGEAVRDKLREVKDSPEKDAYILMDRIRPPKVKAYIMRAGGGRPQLGQVIGELGVFGYILATESNILANEQV